MSDSISDRPTFREWLRAHQPVNSHRPWSSEELRQLDDELGLYSMDWCRIAERHGRSVRAVQQMAAKIGAKR